MTMETLCTFNKYGHCKFGVKCRQFHTKEVCENENCDSARCSKRHPRKCKFYERYQRCKFTEFCSYSHKTTEFSVNEDLLEDMKSRLETLEKDMKEKDITINALNDKIDETRKETKQLKADFKEILESVTKAVLEKATESVVNVVYEKQNEVEKRNTAQLESLHEELSRLSSLLLPSAVAVSKLPQPSQNQCALCGKTFGSSRALANHERNDHNHTPKT